MNNRALVNTVGALALVFSTVSPIWPAGVTLRVDAGRPVHTMRGGLGASWHAMETAIPDRKGGSGWGAYPPAEDNAAWQSLYRHADWLGLD
jgi:hypothetical protein